MDLIAFAGPSLGKPDPKAAQRIDFRGPARCGDITQATYSHPAAIGLIDGLFETVAAVRHKEILSAISEGIVVFGAASIGALRAIELEPFGMVGIGDIFNAFRSGSIEDDDEVAVLHGPAELGFVPLTEAMVNIRATCDAARRAQVLMPEDCRIICRVAKSLFYKNRTWDRILPESGAAGVTSAKIAQLARWLVTNKVDAKRRDALQLVAVMLDFCPNIEAHHAGLEFSRTSYWLDHEQYFRLRRGAHLR